MNSVQNFNFQGLSINIIVDNGEVWFKAQDVCDAIDLSNVSMALKLLEGDERSKFNLGRQGRTNFISEPGLYHLLNSSRKLQAKPFQRWVNHEVLPTIRKTGSYTMKPPKIVQDYLAMSMEDRAIAYFKKTKQARIQAEQLKEQQPKVLFADSVADSDSLILVADLAKVLKQNGIIIGARRLFQWLRGNGYLIKRHGTDYNMPTQYSMELGLFRIKETAITHSNGYVTVSKTSKVTGKGQRYFINKFLKSGAANAKH